MEINGFYQCRLPLEQDLFGELSNSVEFEDVAKGRKGNHLLRASGPEVPIVRTTTQYTKPAHHFSKIHIGIAESIQQEAQKLYDFHGVPLEFNNALIEIYDHQYTKMGYHSDQCMDLAADSYIALFSCYEQPGDMPRNALRKLKVKCKTTDEEFEFTLENNSVILFSLATNAQYMHKIVLEATVSAKSTMPANRWLGITFRQSQTFIHFKDDVPYFSNGERLQLADETQRREFFKLRAQENNGLDFVYPAIAYTLSVGDTLAPIDI